jgi:hypothetical protein
VAISQEAKERVQFEGVWISKRSRDMIRMARFLYKVRGHGAHPALSQGGWSNAVGASAGTHGRDAFDDKLRLLTSRDKKLAWELCLWEVGFAYWRRAAITNLWVEHGHGIPKGGYLSDEAEAQIRQWNQGDNALKSDNDYPRILSSGLVARTWEKWKELCQGGTVDLSEVTHAFETGKPTTTNDIEQIQKRLNRYTDSELLVGGIPGRVTKGVYAAFQSRAYGLPLGSQDADGIPGTASLSLLGLEAVA